MLLVVAPVVAWWLSPGFRQGLVLGCYSVASEPQRRRLVEWGKDREELAEVLYPVALRDEERRLRHLALLSLEGEARNGRDCKRFAPLVVEALKGEGPATFKGQALVTLEAIGEVNPEILSLLEGLVRDHESVAVRLDAIVVLASFGARAEPAVPALIQALLKDPVPLIRSSAAQALGDLRVRPKECAEALLEALRDRDFSVRGRALSALRVYAAHLPEEPGPLLEMLTLKLDDLRQDAETLLLMLGWRKERMKAWLRARRDAATGEKREAYERALRAL